MTTFSATFFARLAMLVDAPCRFTRTAATLVSLATILALGMPSNCQAAIVVTMVGTPAFDLVDTHLFTAPTATYFAAIAPNHVPTRQVHTGYASELANGIAAAGFQEKTVFTVSDFSAPNAVMMGFALVPNALAPNGSSFDFANGPIIPNAGGLPTGSGDVYLNGAPFELGAFGLFVPTDGFDGVSHIVGAVWENNLFAPPGLASLVGDYEYRMTVRDSSGNNGYNVLGTFSVAAVPEPSAMLGLLGATALISLRRRRRA